MQQRLGVECAGQQLGAIRFACARSPLCACASCPLAPQVAAYNANGDRGDLSTASKPFFPGSTAPTAPRSPAATASAANQATVTFQVPESSNGADVTRCACWGGSRRAGRAEPARLQAWPGLQQQEAHAAPSRSLVTLPTLPNLHPLTLCRSYVVEVIHGATSKGSRTFQAADLLKPGVSEGTPALPFAAVVGSLDAGADYAFTVAAVNKNGPSPATGKTNAVAIRDAPSLPVIVSIAGSASSGVTVKFLLPTVGGADSTWAFSVLNSAKTATFISGEPFVPASGAGIKDNPFLATLPLPSLATSGGLYTLTVTAISPVGQAISPVSKTFQLGVVLPPTLAGVQDTAEGLVLSVTVPQTVSVPASSAVKSKDGKAGAKAVAAGTTAAGQPTAFLVVAK